MYRTYGSRVTHGAVTEVIWLYFSYHSPFRSIVQRCFDATYERMKAEGLKADAIELKTATVHWLRHTGISEDVKSSPA